MGVITTLLPEAALLVRIDAKSHKLVLQPTPL